MKTTIKNNEEDFFRKIERKFNQLRGGPLLISPRDWALMVEWDQRGIPASVIIEALEKGFEKASYQGTSKKSIHSLSYFKGIVEEQWKSFQKRKVGKEEKESSDADLSKIREYLEYLCQSLEACATTISSDPVISKVLKEASYRIHSLMEKNLNSPDEMESAEEQLSLIDEEIGECLINDSDKETIEALLGDAETELSSMGHFMKDKHYKDIKKRYLLKKLRKKYGIPRVSLYFQ